VSGWYGVDLDGTLAFYDGTVEHVGAPILRMAERVKAWLDEGREVRIVTARVSPEWDDVEQQTTMIQEWCVEHFGVALPVQCHKDGSMIELWDDRAVGVVKNYGERLEDAIHAYYKEYDQLYGIEGDAYADCEPEQAWENGGVPLRENRSTIGVYPCLGTDQCFYINSREARVLAATLLRAADDADALLVEGYANLVARPCIATDPDGTRTAGISISRKDE